MIWSFFFFRVFLDWDWDCSRGALEDGSGEAEEEGLAVVEVSREGGDASEV